MERVFAGGRELRFKMSSPNVIELEGIRYLKRKGTSDAVTKDIPPEFLGRWFKYCSSYNEGERRIYVLHPREKPVTITREGIRLTPDREITPWRIIDGRYFFRGETKPRFVSYSQKEGGLCFSPWKYALIFNERDYRKD